MRCSDACHVFNTLYMHCYKTHQPEVTVTDLPTSNESYFMSGS